MGRTGSTDGGEWLTVWASACRTDLVYATREAAEERARSVQSESDRVTVAYVQRAGLGYFRIVPAPDVTPST